MKPARARKATKLSAYAVAPFGLLPLLFSNVWCLHPRRRLSAFFALYDLKRSRGKILAPCASIAAYEALYAMPNRAPPEAFQPFDWLVRRACLKAQTSPQLADAIRTAYALGGYQAVWRMLDPLEGSS